MSDSRSPGWLRRLMAYIILPREITAFEASYLHRMNRVGIAFFAVHVPVITLIAWGNATRPWFALVLTAAIVAGPAIAYGTLKNPRTVSITCGVAAMFMGGALVHFGQGPVQVEMHFYFFALIAMLAVYANPLVILAAAVTVMLHHLVLWWLLPQSVLNYDAPLWVVGVHAAFVVLVSVAACFIARSFFDYVIGLERIVSARTAELDGRNRDMRLVLDNVSQGFVTIDRSGLPSAERSRVLDQWLGPSVAEETLFDWLDRKSPEVAAQSRMAWDEVTAGFLPLALTLEQMPKDISLGAAQCRIAYLPIGDGEMPERFLVVVTDVTADLERDRAERDRREALQVFEQVIHDRTAVNDFFDEGTRLVDAITARAGDGLPALKRMLHTLKGNSAIFGLEGLSSLCHELETIVAEEQRQLRPPELARLRAQWDGAVENVDRLIGARRHVIEVEEDQYAALERTVRSAAPRAAVLDAVRALKREPTARRLEHFAEQARRIAAGLGKSIDVRVQAGDLRIDPTQWAGFWSAFIHAVRNAADHGLEGHEERVSTGKAECGTIRLGTYARGDRFVVEIADDGRGIDWPLVAVKAAELGLPTDTLADLHTALFLGGVSTATNVTDISGRGIGMGALRAATLALHGEIEIETKLGLGTTFRMVFPQTAMAPEVASRAEACAPAA
jgi:two-component system, chemotaxis family, sensor kinase CheA